MRIYALMVTFFVQQFSTVEKLYMNSWGSLMLIMLSCHLQDQCLAKEESYLADCEGYTVTEVGMVGLERHDHVAH